MIEDKNKGQRLLEAISFVNASKTNGRFAGSVVKGAKKLGSVLASPFRKKPTDKEKAYKERLNARLQHTKDIHDIKLQHHQSKVGISAADREAAAKLRSSANAERDTSFHGKQKSKLELNKALSDVKLGQHKAKTDISSSAIADREARKAANIKMRSDAEAQKRAERMKERETSTQTSLSVDAKKREARQAEREAAAALRLKTAARAALSRSRLQRARHKQDQTKREAQLNQVVATNAARTAAHAERGKIKVDTAKEIEKSIAARKLVTPERPASKRTQTAGSPVTIHPDVAAKAEVARKKLAAKSAAPATTEQPPKPTSPTVKTKPAKPVMGTPPTANPTPTPPTPTKPKRPPAAAPTPPNPNTGSTSPAGRRLVTTSGRAVNTTGRAIRGKWRK